MSNPWEVPQYDLPIGHATPNPTEPWHEPTASSIGGEQAWPAASNMPPAEGAWQAQAPGQSIPLSFALLPGRKRAWLAISLALLFGPFGLFYVSFLNGIAALAGFWIVIWPLAHSLAESFHIAVGMDGPISMLLSWCFMIAWAIIATVRHNARL
jgi:hypothetical protein